MTPPRTALVLSGGGSRGAYQAGVCIGLLDGGFRPDIICGTSVGAINGALIASGAPAEDLARIWTALGTRRLTQPRKDLWRLPQWDAWSRNDDLAQIIRSHIDFDRLGETGISLVVTAVGLCCGELVAFQDRDITAEHVLASTAFPGVFPPVRIGDEHYVDGGIVQNTPLKPAIDAGATDILAVTTDPVDHCMGDAPGNLVETLFRVSDIQSHHALLRAAHHAETINELLRRRQHWKDWRHLDIAFIAPSEPLGGALFEVDEAQTHAWLAQGRADASTHLARRQD